MALHTGSGEGTASPEVDKPIKFWVGEKGLETRIAEVLSNEEFNSRDPNDFEPNMHWYDVTVASQADKEAWVKTQDLILAYKWTPNQSRAEQTEGAAKIKELEAKLKELESKVGL